MQKTLHKSTPSPPVTRSLALRLAPHDISLSWHWLGLGAKYILAYFSSDGMPFTSNNIQVDGLRFGLLSATVVVQAFHW